MSDVRKSWEFSPLPWLTSVSSSMGLMWVRGQYSSRACSSSPPRFTAAQTHSQLIFIIYCHHHQTPLEARLTFRVGSVRAGESSVFSRNPGRKAVALVQRYRQHLSITRQTINKTFTEEGLQHRPVVTHPCLQIHRKPVRHINHLEPFLDLFIKLHLAQVFNFTGLQNRVRQRSSYTTASVQIDHV